MVKEFHEGMKKAVFALISQKPLILLEVRFLIYNFFVLRGFSFCKEILHHLNKY